MYCRKCKGGTHWSHMDCSNIDPHKPHVWDAAYLCFGPYMCAGVTEPKAPSVPLEVATK